MRITHATPLPPTSLRLRWDDGFEATLDLAPALPPGDTLRDPALFALGRPNGLTVEWPGGIDYCPDTLRLWCERGRVLPQEETHAAFAS